jgi:hypothetical protein
VGDWGTINTLSLFSSKNRWGGEKMKKKIGLIIVSALFLVIISLSATLTFAQRWQSVTISAYGTDVVEGDPVPEIFSFIVAEPTPAVTNTIIAINNDTGENFFVDLEVGDVVQVGYLGGLDVTIKNILAAPTPGEFIIQYEGQASSVTINAAQIPEFPPILIIPMFTAATLLAIIYERRTRHSKLTD